MIALSPIPAVNVAAVPQRSPLRYPGGKTWLIPHVRAWLGGMDAPPRLLVEPFAGGGVVSLTAVMENLAERCLMAELDRDVAAFWSAALHHGPDLVRLVREFVPSRDAVEALERANPAGVVERGFRTLVLNRTRRGGVLADGARLTRNGENGAGVASRWYADTLTRRLQAVGAHADRIAFRETDGAQLLDEMLRQPNGEAVFFVDPPYTGAGGKRAGRRLYAHSEVDHARLFATLAESGANFLMTYDCSPEIESLIASYEFHAVRVMMKNGHHERLPELVITPSPVFAEAPAYA